MNISEIGTSDGNNITLTSAFYQDGSTFKSSQWDDSGSSIYYSGGNVGIGTVSPAAKLDVSGLIKTDHLSLAISQYPSVGDGKWITVNLNTYNGNAGPNAPYPEGGILFSNIDADSIFKWGYYMGVVKPSASDQSNSQRLDIGRSINVESQISGGSGGTFIPSLTIFNDNVGIGTTSPNYKLDVSGDFRCARFFTADYGYWKRIYVAGDYSAGQARLYFINSSNLNTYLYATGFTTFSDDRLKEQEELVINGLDICRKLRPQTYMKKNTFTSTDKSLWKKETGFIAQEVYYDIPELRHIVSTGNSNNDIPDNITTSSDPSVDPDYSSWGSDEASLNYNEFIPYTVSAIQEIDRRQATDDERILELEETVSIQQQKLEEQSQLITSLQASILELTKSLDAL